MIQKKPSRPYRKLTPQDVREIRASKGTQVDIAARYRVSQGQVSLIRAGRAWKHV